MHPFPVDPTKLNDPPEEQGRDPHGDRPQPQSLHMRRRTRDIGRAVLAIFMLAVIAIVVLVLL